jgi:transcriptional regulator with XRE-family HTH domain
MYRGKRLMVREWREARFLPQLELADKAGLARQTIVTLEKADTEVRPTNIRKLAAALELEPADLFRLPPALEEESQ